MSRHFIRIAVCKNFIRIFTLTRQQTNFKLYKKLFAKISFRLHPLIEPNSAWNIQLPHLCQSYKSPNSTVLIRCLRESCFIVVLQRVEFFAFQKFLITGHSIPNRANQFQKLQVSFYSSIASAILLSLIKMQSKLHHIHGTSSTGRLTEIVQLEILSPPPQNESLFKYVYSVSQIPILNIDKIFYFITKISVKGFAESSASFFMEASHIQLLSNELIGMKIRRTPYLQKNRLSVL